MLEGTPREIFTKADVMEAAGLTVPQTVEILHKLNQSGANLSINAMNVTECADILQAYLEA